jgi:hypothetical protein
MRAAKVKARPLFAMLIPVAFLFNSVNTDGLPANRDMMWNSIASAETYVDDASAGKNTAQ